jgi:hypothetical protein
MPLSLLNNEKMVEKIAKQGIALQAKVTRDRFECTDRQKTNPQTHWEAYKASIHKLAKEAAKECYHKIASRIKVLERDLKETNNSPDISTSREKQMHGAHLASHLKHLKKKEARN